MGCHAEDGLGEAAGGYQEEAGGPIHLDLRPLLPGDRYRPVCMPGRADAVPPDGLRKGASPRKPGGEPPTQAAGMCAPELPGTDTHAKLPAEVGGAADDAVLLWGRERCHTPNLSWRDVGHREAAGLSAPSGLHFRVRRFVRGGG